jgi:hypothetical protein
VKCEDDAYRKGEAEGAHDEAVERVQGWLGPKHEGEQEVEDLNGGDGKEIAFEHFVVGHHVHGGHAEAEVVLCGLTEVKESVEGEERHTAGSTRHDQAHNEAAAAEARVHPEETFMKAFGPSFAKFGCIRLPVHAIKLYKQSQSSF